MREVWWYEFEWEVGRSQIMWRRSKNQCHFFYEATFLGSSKKF
jgi:hypothetical protein